MPVKEQAAIAEYPSQSMRHRVECAVGQSQRSFQRAIRSAVILGPWLSLLSSIAFFPFALADLISRDLGIWPLAVIALCLSPIATITAAPLAKAWLQNPWGDYWGALINGSLLGIAWTAVGLIIAGLLPGQLVGDFGPSALAELALFCIAVGIPFGMAHAAVFWVALQRNIAAERGIRLPKQRTGEVLIAAVVLPWLLQFVASSLVSFALR